MLDALIFDIDGTLLDSNRAHVDAWAGAFEQFGYRIAPDRIEREIGKGGDRLVADVLGDQAEARHGEALRECQTAVLLELVVRSPIALIPGALELLDAARGRGLRTALSTSSTRAHLDALLASAGADLCARVDSVVTRRPDDRSKPAPDLVAAAVDALRVAPTQCAMVGDTRFDAVAACRAGVTCLAVRSGGKTEEELLGGGARGVWRDCADLLVHLDEALALASPARGALTADLLAQLMRAALEVARDGLRAGEAPIGCIIADGDRRIVARAHNEVGSSGHLTAHAEMQALRALDSRQAACPDGLLLVTTLEPCVMCLGAAIVAGVDTIVYAAPAPQGTGSRRVAPSGTRHHQLPRMVGGVLAEDSRALLGEWLLTEGGPHRAACAQRLVATA